MPAEESTNDQPGPRKGGQRGFLKLDAWDWSGLIVSLVLLGAPLLLLLIPSFPFSLWKVAKNLWIGAPLIPFVLIARRIKSEDWLELLLGLSGQGVTPPIAAIQAWQEKSHGVDWKKLWNLRNLVLGMAVLVVIAFVLVRYGNPFASLVATRIKVLKPVLFCTDRSASDLAAQTGTNPDSSMLSTICQGQTAVCASVFFGEAKEPVEIDEHSDAPPGTETVTDPQVKARITYLAMDEFYERLRRETEESPKRDAFLFVHGFRNSFEDALGSAAGLAVHLKFKGAPVAFSWPAEKGSIAEMSRNYGGDSRRVAVGANDLAILLPELRQRSGAQTFHVIAHSIGSTVTAQAELQASAQLPQSPKPFANTILAAPDITPELFHQQVGTVQRASDRLTIYFSHGDVALFLSRLVQEGGRVGAGTPPIPGADVIDATNVDTGVTGHSYVFTGFLLRDIFDLFQMPTSPATDRPGVMRDSQTGVYRLTKQ